MPTFGSLFSGVGGMDLGLERAGWTCRFQVEIDPYCQKVLAKHWPQVKRYGDIKELTGHELEPVDLIAAGIPCQPTSLAGKRQGQSDARWLWPDTARLLGVLRPRLVLLENTPGILSAGRGSAFGDILGDLARLGYDAEWQSLPAAAFGAPHLRYRVFIVAHARCQRLENGRAGVLETPMGALLNDEPELGGEALADTSSARHSPLTRSISGHAARPYEPEYSHQSKCSCPDVSDTSRERLPQRQIFGRSTGPIERSDWWDPQCRLGEHPDGPASRVDCGGWECGIPRVTTQQPNRVQRLRALGNAVVPHVAEWIGRRILASFREETA